MQKLKRQHTIDLDKFAIGEGELEIKYGLPRKVEFCKKCVISNQRPNSAFEYSQTKDTKKKTVNFDNGVCDACKVAEEKKKINWNEREKELWELCDRYRKNDGSYDCLVPGSGGKDSFYTAHILKYKYKMHPLTVTWAPHIYTSWGWNNLQAWVHAGFDNYLCTSNGKVHRLLTRLALENIFHPFQPFIIGQKSLTPRLACLFKIPLVFYGENEAEYGNPSMDNETAERDQSYFATDNMDKIFLSGTSISDLKGYFGIDENDLQSYLPAHQDELRKEKVTVHYLGYYLKWHPQSCYYYAVENSDFKPAPERTPGTYSKYNSIDDKIDDFHFYTYLIKFGIGRATYDAAQEIRSGDITREEGVALVKKFDGEFPERFANEIFNYLSINPKEYPEASKMFEQPIMDQDYFMNLTDRFRSPHLWKKENKSWIFRHAVWH